MECVFFWRLPGIWSLRTTGFLLFSVPTCSFDAGCFGASFGVGCNNRTLGPVRETRERNLFDLKPSFWWVLMTGFLSMDPCGYGQLPFVQLAFPGGIGD